MATPGTFLGFGAAAGLFPVGLEGIVQVGMLERELSEGLDSVLAYRRECVREVINARIGETLTRTRKGRKTPVYTALTPTAMTGLDNGLTPSSYSMEQYSFTLAPYADTVDVDLLEELAMIADQLVANSRNNGVQAAQSLERIARFKLFSAYTGGNTRVRTDIGSSSTTTAHVDDVRGFQTVLVNGVVTSVSATNTLTVTEVATSGSGVNQTLTVTGVAVDATNHSSAPDGSSGVLTFSTATAPVNGDALIAANAAKIFRPGGKVSTGLLTGSDAFTLSIVEDVVAYLRDNAVPPMEDGTYHCILDNTSMRQLFADPDFKLLYSTNYKAPEYKNQDIVTLLDMTFIPTTEAYIQQPNVDAQGVNTSVGVSTRVRRPIVMGAESLIEGDFEGLEIWLNRQGVSPIGNVMLVNGVAQVVRPPLDRLQKVISMSWHWVGDFAVPTDLTATTSVIPTASNALYKRSAVIEVAG